MRLWLARRHWNLFAKTDPYWAVLTEPDKQGQRWKIDEFFETGRNDVRATLQRVREVLPDWRPAGDALDFGCGVGRLSQALASHFDRVTGVDISREMLAHARRHNRHGERVTYIENTEPSLARFADGSFAFVLSLITLQHIAPEYSCRYVEEFIRTCASGGVVVFQLPARALRPPKPRRFTLWLPTHWKRLKPALRRWLVLEATMEMHPVPRPDVEAIVAKSGGSVVAVDSLPNAGPDYVSYRYIVRRT